MLEVEHWSEKKDCWCHFSPHGVSTESVQLPFLFSAVGHILLFQPCSDMDKYLKTSKEFINRGIFLLWLLSHRFIASKWKVDSIDVAAVKINLLKQ